MTVWPRWDTSCSVVIMDDYIGVEIMVASLLHSLSVAWHMFLSLWNFERVVSTVAIIVSVWTVFYSKRNTKAAERSAEAAINQANDASSQADLAVKTSEASAIETAYSRIDRNAPSATVAIDYVQEAPFIVEASCQVLVPHPEPDQNKIQKLDYNRVWSWYAYFVLRGSIYNDGDRAVRVYPKGPVFYPGSHPVTHEEVPLPQRTVRGPYLLYPGQIALFPILVWRSVNEWLELQKTDVTQHESSFHLQPGGLDKPNVVVKIETEGCPVRRQTDKSGDWIVLKPGCDVTTKIERGYPTSFDWLHATLKNDEDKLHWLHWHEWARSAVSRREGESG
jgi:hypothetical protein